MDDLFDDSIADLLSEGSNDSFFEDPKSKNKKVTKPISNVFDLEEDKKKSADVIPVESTFKNKPVTDLFPKPRERKSSFHKDDISDLLDVDVKKPKADVDLFSKSKEPKRTDKDDINDLLDMEDTKKSKSSVMNDILGITMSDEKKVTNFDDLLKSSKIESKKLETVDTKPSTSLVTLGRRGRRVSATNLDPLGLLEGPSRSPVHEPKPSKSAGLLETSVVEKPQAISSKSVTFIEKKEGLFSDLPTQRSKREGRRLSIEQPDLPDWLKGDKKSTTESIVDSGLSSIITSAPEIKSISTLHKNLSAKPSNESVQEAESTTLIDSLLKQQKLTASNMEIQNSSLALQQQESQLMMALQLKKYEQNLSDMQRTQQDILLKQEQQFTLLIEKQLAKQQTIEENMRLQQERINNHIQLLLAQPSSTSMKQTFEEHQRKEDFLKETFEENRAFYNDIISSLKQKHNEEIGLLEESYRKQISFLEMSLESTETRLKSEIENVTTYFDQKLSQGVAKNAQIVDEYELKIQKINQQNDSIVHELKENYNELVRGVKEEYQRMMEDFRKSAKRDEEIFGSAGEYTEKLNTGIEILKNNTNIVNEMQASVRNEKDLLRELKSESLNVKEQEIKMMKESLEKQRLASDNERAQLIALVRTLEMRLVEQTQAAREEQWTLQQATATIAARALAMDREVEYIKNNLEFERQQLKTLKEKQLAENEKVIQLLTEEKLAVATEKAKLETSVKLNQSYDVSRGKAEIEAALQVAKEATEATDRERLDLIRQKSELEILKRNLFDREKFILSKEDELKNISKISEQKYKEGDRCITEARTIESKSVERMREIQRHAQSLATRERKLAEEKIALSRERVAIHTTENRCSLCRVDVLDETKNEDLDLMRLRFELDDNIPTSEREND